MTTISSAAMALLVMLATSWANASVVGFWDFNSASLARSQGSSGTMTTALAGVSVADYQSLALAGTTVNTQPSIPAGSSLSFVSLLSIAEIGEVTITGLDFTGLQNVQFSFAIADDSVTVGTNAFALDYDTGSGWQTFSGFAEPDTTFAVRSFDLSGIAALNGAPNAGLRIRFAETLNAIDVLSFDNVTVTAVPEPSEVATAVAGFCIVALILRRRNSGMETAG